MNDRWTLTSGFNGRLQIPGRPEPLGFGESCPWIGPLNEMLNSYIGAGHLKAVRTVESTLPKVAAPAATPVSELTQASSSAAEGPQADPPKGPKKR